MTDRRFADLIHQRMRGIEGRRGALRDIRDFPPAQRASFIGGDRPEIGAAEDNLAVDNMTESFAEVVGFGESVLSVGFGCGFW